MRASLNFPTKTSTSPNFNFILAFLNLEEEKLSAFSNTLIAFWGVLFSKVK